jgi:hypothetical protein
MMRGRQEVPRGTDLKLEHFLFIVSVVLIPRTSELVEYLSIAFPSTLRPNSCRLSTSSRSVHVLEPEPLTRPSQPGLFVK